jgi:formate hydrogenlyase transcriptional activator
MASDSSASRAGERIPLAHPEALTDPEQLVAAYFSSSTVGLSILDPELRYLAINDALAAMNGRPAADHLGKTAREILGDFADIVEPKLQHVLTTGQPVHFEVSAQLPARTEVGHWILHYLPIKNATGAVNRIGALVVEITAQRKLEESLRDADRKLHIEMDRLQMLLEVTNILSSNWNVQQVFPRVSARIRRVLHQECATFASYDAATGLLVRQAVDFPLARGFTDNVQIFASNSPAGRSLQEHTPMIFSTEQLQDFDTDITKGVLAEGLRSLCCVPLLRPQGPLGVLVLGSTRKDAFQPEDLTLLNQVAIQFAVAIENHKAAAEIETLKRRLGEETKYLEEESRSEGQFAEIIGVSLVLRQVLDQIATVAPSDTTVLILGATGTGKELVARAIHRMSTRKDEIFVKLNCAAIPTGLLESELFGHEKGAFTGAVTQKVGRMELAHGGTLFLDEVGEIPPELQPKLLRVLQDQEFERLGSTRTIKVNVRLVAATNRDLARSVAEHQFRSDLFYRLFVFPIRVPALRERPEDIPLLVRYFVRKFAQRMNRHIETVPTETMNRLMAWSWPGNVRELENLMERSVILSQGNVLRVSLSELVPAPVSYAQPDQASQADHTLDNAERMHIIRVLREVGGVLSGPRGAANRLGLKRTTLQSKMRRLKITPQDYSGPSSR